MIPSHSSLLLFVSAALVLLAIPGPAVLYVTSRSIGLGRSAGLVSALGIGVGTLVHVAAAALGLSAVLMSSAAAFSLVKYLGAAYLIYLGVQKLRREESSRTFARSGSGQTEPRLWARHHRQYPESEDRALFLRLPAAICGRIPRKRCVASSPSGDAFRGNGRYRRQSLGTFRRNRCAPSEPKHSLAAHAAVRIGRNADFARRGHGVRGFWR
jgi:hypothetical protein